MGASVPTPSLLTSVITLPWCLYAIVALIQQISAPVAVAVWAVVFAVVIAANFALIYRLKPALERRLTEHPTGASPGDE